MSKILSKLFGLGVLSELSNQGLQPTKSSRKNRKRGNVLGDHFYKFLSFKRNKQGKWQVRK